MSSADEKTPLLEKTTNNSENGATEPVQVTAEKVKVVEEKIEAAADTVKKVSKNAATLLWNELPPWMRDNHYIQSGYRHPSGSFRGSSSSIFAIHNETVNIWSHMLTAISFYPIAWFLYTQVSPRYAQLQPTDVAVFSCFIVGVDLCLTMSASFHTISNHSQTVMHIGNRLDYVGIVCCIWGSYIPTLYYGLNPVLWHVYLYWAMITVVAAATLMAVLLPKFNKPEWRVFRTATFIAMGVSGIVPVLHGLRIYGPAQLDRQMSLSWTVAQGALYIVGACIYAARIPERWAPGSFDIWGSSHQIFHIFIVAAGMVHLTGLIKAFDYNHSIRMSL